jgi:hypothetical protein
MFPRFQSSTLRLLSVIKPTEVTKQRENCREILAATEILAKHLPESQRNEINSTLDHLANFMQSNPQQKAAKEQNQNQETLESVNHNRC